MNIFHFLSVFSVVIKSVYSETETNAAEPNMTRYTVRNESFIPVLDELWSYKQGELEREQGAGAPMDQGVLESRAPRVVLAHPYSLSRLVKTLSEGFNPQILQEEDLSIERRRRPVTLIGIKKHGMFPHQHINIADESSEVAELQSPYNDISEFWEEETP